MPFTSPPAARFRIRVIPPAATSTSTCCRRPTSSSPRAALHTFRNLLLFHNDLTGELFRKQWLDAGVPARTRSRACRCHDARIIKQAVSVPVICTGGFQTASIIRKAITDGDCDGVSIARPLVANNDLVKQFAAGRDRAERPCTYCNSACSQVVEHRSAATRRAGSRAATRCCTKCSRCSSRRRSDDRAAARGPHGDPGRGRPRGRRSCCGWSSRFGPIGRSPTRTSRSTSSTDRSAASRADRCSRRSAACCRRTGCSRRCRRSAATASRAAGRRLGFVIEPGKDLPIGVSRRRRLGIDQVGLNCAVCHTGTVRDAPDAAAKIVLGMPAQQLEPRRPSCSSCSTARSTTG